MKESLAGKKFIDQKQEINFNPFAIASDLKLDGSFSTKKKVASDIEEGVS